MICSLYGYYDEMTFDGLAEDDIDYIESQNRTKTIEKIAGKADPILFLGPFYYESPQHFEINRGERKQLKHLVTLVSDVKSQNKRDFFKINKFKIDYNQMIYNQKIDGYYFGKPNQSMVQKTSNGKDDTNFNDDLVTSLRSTLKSTILKLNVTEDEIDTLLTSIQINANGNPPDGSVECGWCAKNGKKNIIKIGSKQNIGRKGACIYWVPSNFATHFKRVHLPKNANGAISRTTQSLDSEIMDLHDESITTIEPHTLNVIDEGN